MMSKGLTEEKERLKHNLLGQKLGRKGRDTRERIMAAAQRLLAAPADTKISLSAVAREASLGMTSIYLYFNDLTELLLAVLEPITAASEELYASYLATPWLEQTMDVESQKFVEAYYSFWVRHARILHLRNSLANSNEQRMRQHRSMSAETPIRLLARQMGYNSVEWDSPFFVFSSALYSGLEHIVIIATDVNSPGWLGDGGETLANNLLKAEARLLVLGVRDGRLRLRSSAA